MSHMVIFRSSDGKTGYHQADAIDEAIRFVERLRNAEGVEQAKIFRLDEVGFEFKPYYRVEVAGVAAAPEPAPSPSPSSAPSSASSPLEDVGEADPDAELAELEMTPVPEPEEAGRRGLFGR